MGKKERVGYKEAAEDKKKKKITSEISLVCCSLS